MREVFHYYLLDGEEYGPFSRSAIIKLIGGRLIDGALFRSDPEDAWQTIDEVGLVSKPIALPRVDEKAAGSRHESVHSPLQGDAKSISQSSAGQVSKANAGHTGPILACCVFVVLCVGAWYLFYRDTHLPVIPATAIHPQVQMIPEATAINGQENAGTVSSSQGEMKISGEYLIDKSSMMFSPDKESLDKYPALLLNDGALTIENAKLAFEQMSIDLASLESNCRYEGRATVVVKNSREQTPECDQGCAQGDCGDSCDPYPVASVVSVQGTTPPKPIPDYAGMCKSAAVTVDNKAGIESTSLGDPIVLLLNSNYAAGDCKEFGAKDPIALKNGYREWTKDGSPIEALLGKPSIGDFTGDGVPDVAVLLTCRGPANWDIDQVFVYDGTDIHQPIQIFGIEDLSALYPGDGGLRKGLAGNPTIKGDTLTIKAYDAGNGSNSCPEFEVDLSFVYRDGKLALSSSPKKKPVSCE